MAQQLGAHSLALLVYPGLVAVAVFGVVAELAWNAIAHRRLLPLSFHLRRPAPSIVIGAVFAALAASQLAAPFNLIAAGERNLLVAVAALALLVWTAEQLPDHAPLLLVAQLCWAVAALGTAVEPQSLRPSVLGANLLSGLLPLKVACGVLYLACLPVLLRLVPRPEPDRRRSPARFDGARALHWLPYCGLFATVFFPPSGDDLFGVLRFVGLSAGAAVAAILLAVALTRWGAQTVPVIYRFAVGPFAIVVLLLVGVTSLLMR